MGADRPAVLPVDGQSTRRRAESPLHGGRVLREGTCRRILGGNFESGGWAYRFYVPNLPTSESTPFASANGFMLASFADAANIPSVSFTLGTDGAVVAYLSADGGLGVGIYPQGALLQRSNPCIIPAAYNHIEFYALPAPSDGGFEVRVNGVTVLNFHWARPKDNPTGPRHR